MEIVLIRHGKPEAAINPRLTASGYRRWIGDYAVSKVADGSLPEPHLKHSLAEHYLVSSDLIRAVDSTQICMAQSPALQLPILREMEIPSYWLPLRLKAWTWLYLSRVLWTLGLPCRSESFGAAKRRAEKGAVELIELAQQHQKVAVFCHGYMNAYLRKNLKRAGWTLHHKSNQYWGVSTLSYSN